MGLNFLKLKQKKEKIFLGLDIGTEAVKALIFSTQKFEEQRKKKEGNEKIIILGTGLQYFDRYDVFNGKDFEKDVIKRAISKAIEQAYQSLSFSSAKKELKEKAQKQKKQQLLLTLPANIIKGRIISQSFYRESPKEKISKTEERIISQRVSETAQKEISQRFAKESGLLPEDIHWISLKILGMKINDYPVLGLRGYEGKNLDFKILAIFLPKYYFENIKRIIKDLKLEILCITHPAESLPNACKEEKKNGIFLDVGGEITQIFLIKDGKLQQTQEFKVGGKAFSQTLSQILGIDEENSRLLKERYSNKLLSAESTKRIREILTQGQRIWYKNLKLRIKEIKPKELLSSTIFLFGGGSLLPEIQEVLKEGVAAGWGDLSFGERSEEFSKELLSGVPKVRFIYPKDLENIEDTTKGLRSPQVVPSLLVCYKYAQKNF